MKEKEKQVNIIKTDFTEVQPILTAIGDETRQLILLVLMGTSCDTGMRVGELTAKTYLSRPAVSHQVKILKDLGLVRCRKEGTKNYYYIDVSHNRELFGKMKKLSSDIESFMETEHPNGGK